MADDRLDPDSQRFRDALAEARRILGINDDEENAKLAAYEAALKRGERPFPPEGCNPLMLSSIHRQWGPRYFVGEFPDDRPWWKRLFQRVRRKTRRLR